MTNYDWKGMGVMAHNLKLNIQLRLEEVRPVRVKKISFLKNATIPTQSSAYYIL